MTPKTFVVQQVNTLTAVTTSPANKFTKLFKNNMRMEKQKFNVLEFKMISNAHTFGPKNSALHGNLLIMNAKAILTNSK